MNTNARVTIDTSGNVGIGTTTPAQRLEIENTGSTTPLRVEDSSNTCDFGVDGSGWASISCSSDQALKENITNISQQRLTSISDWVLNYPLKEYTITQNGERQIGVIAQDIQALNSSRVKNMIFERNGTNETYLAVDVPTMKDLLITIKELEKRIIVLEAR